MLVYIKQVGPNLAMIEPLGAVDPGFGVPGGGGDPGYGHPIFGGHPDQGLPGGRPPHVGGRPPGSGSGIPDQSLPPVPPPTLLPGYTLVMVRTADGKWHYATVAPGSPPPRPLPEPIPPGGAPDQGLPPQPVAPDQGLPPTAAPKA